MNDTKKCRLATEDFKMKIAKNFDGRTFALFLKYLQEIKTDVLDKHEATSKKGKKAIISPDYFLIFLDKMKTLTHSKQLNEMILSKLADINLNRLRTKNLLNTYEKHSADFKFEEKIRMGEIKKFAEDVIPTSRFIFNHYQTEVEHEAEDEPEEDSEYFSFFGSHEQAILKPESNFENVSHPLLDQLL